MNKDGAEQNKADIVQPSVGGYMIPYGYPPQEDEIRLIDYWRVLVKLQSLIIIFGLTAIAIIGAVLYALSLTPVYKAKTVFLPPTPSDIQGLNIQGVNDINSDIVYSKFIQKLHASAPRHTVFEKMNLLPLFTPEGDQHANPNEIFDDFNQSLTVTTPKIKTGDPVNPAVAFTMEGEDPVLIAEIVNRIAKVAKRVTIATIISNIQANINTNIKNINQEINQLRVKAIKLRLDEIERLKAADALERKTITDKISSMRQLARNERFAEIARLEEADSVARNGIQEKILTLQNSAKKKRSDRLATLKEAASIAHTLGINDLIDYRLKIISHFEEPQPIDLFNNNIQPYARGYEAIEAEIASLSNRTNDNPFIPELRGLQYSLKLLEKNERIAALKSRENDDPFIPELQRLQAQLKLLDHNQKVEQLNNRQNDDPFIPSLRDKQNELAKLESIHIDPLTVTAARQDQAAYPSNNRIKPNRSLIVILGFAFGLMLGIFGAFFCNFLKTEQKKMEER